jgi:ankyrin repeat protein
MKYFILPVVLILSLMTTQFSCKGAYEGALADAARTGNTQDIEKYIGRGADVNAQWFGRTPLQVAAEEGQLKALELLIAKGADVNAKSKFDKTALDYAEEKSRTDVIAFLKTKGATRTAAEKK